jgi:GT2 family glycosyltransferase
MTISVLIATYNRAPLLKACLASLSGQEYEAGDEVVIADNGSTDDTAAVVEDAVRRFAVPLRYVRETRAGKSHALSAAVAGCRADVLALTDDDVRVGPEWIARIRAVMREPGAALVGGRVLPIFQARVPDWLDLRDANGFGMLAAPLALLDYGPAPQPLGTRAALGANLAVRRSAFEAAGGFDGALGKLRGTLLSGEDHQLCERLQHSGHLALYDPTLVVNHVVPAERLRATYFLRWFFWSGVTHARLDAARPAQPAKLLGAPRYLFRQLGSSLALAVVAALRAGWTAVMLHGARAAFALGYIWTTWSRHGPGPVTRAGVETA